MIEYAYIGGSVFLSVLLSVFLTVVYLKRKINSDLIAENIEILLTDEKIIQKIYTLSGVIGHGLANGSGLKNVTTQRGQKLKIEDLVMQLLVNSFDKNKNQPQNIESQTINRELTPS